MTRDYAKPSTTRSAQGKARKKPAKRKPVSRKPSAPPPPPKRGKLYAVLVLLIAGFVGGIYFLQTIPATQSPLKSTEKNSTTSTSSKAPSESSASKSASSEQRFKFYDLLPESEVVAPKVDSYQYREKNTSNDFYYLVQTGSFRSSADAEKQKATIAFQGLKASIKPVTNDQGTVWYRVMTGPFYSRSEMNSALDKLVAIQIEPLVKKVKK